MRIQNDGIAASAASQSAAAENSPQAVSSPQSSAANSGADVIEISSLSGGVSAAASQLAGRQAERVSQLAALYAKGEYHVDSAQLSHALVNHALSGRTVEEDS